MQKAAVVTVIVFFLAREPLLSEAMARHLSDFTATERLGAVEAVVSALSQYSCPMLLMVNNATQITASFLKEVKRVHEPRGVAVFQAAADNLNGNVTQTHLRETVDRVRQMSELWHCLALVVVSDDSTFLAAFAHLSLRRHALRWSTRILFLTRLPLTELGGLHGLLSNRNAMLLHIRENAEGVSSVGVYVATPYSSPGTRPRMVATWTPNNNWTPALQEQLFPEKFAVFSSAPTLTVAIELLPQHTLSRVEDPDAPEGYRLVYRGYMDNTIRYFAKAMNFTYKYVLSPERTFGAKLPDGSWTGMMGMVVREEVDFGAGPFQLSPVRAEAADHTVTIGTGNVRMVSGLGSLKVDPWSFLLSLTPLVWASTLTALLGVVAVLQLLPACLCDSMLGHGDWPASNAFSCVRVILQQDIVLPTEWWWWERLVLGLWMLTTLVLTKSYAGNLMSLLAVRHVPQPFQTPRDVLDDPRVSMIWQKYSKNEQFLREVKYGVFREVAALEKKGRLLFHTQAQFQKSLDTLVRAGDCVLVDLDVSIKHLVALDVSQKGRCDFYISRDGFLPFSSSLMSYKTNPIIYGLNPRIISLTESGIFTYWLEKVPNFTLCDDVPQRLLFTTTLSTTNLWGVFAVLAVGLTAGLVVLCAELLVRPYQHHCLPLPLPSASAR